MDLTLVIILLILFPSVFNQSDVNNYGPYKISWKSVTSCKGPKPVNCGLYQLDNTQDPSDLIFRFELPKGCPVTGAKVMLFNNQNNSSKNILNYVLNKPCQHFVLGPILIDAFNLTNTCKINKGNFNIHINLIEKTMAFLGSNFFYGSYAFKVVAFNRATNLFCAISTVDVVKSSKT